MIFCYKINFSDGKKVERFQECQLMAVVCLVVKSLRNDCKISISNYYKINRHHIIRLTYIGGVHENSVTWGNFPNLEYCLHKISVNTLSSPIRLPKNKKSNNLKITKPSLQNSKRKIPKPNWILICSQLSSSLSFSFAL